QCPGGSRGRSGGCGRGGGDAGSDVGFHGAGRGACAHVEVRRGEGDAHHAYVVRAGRDVGLGRDGALDVENRVIVRRRVGGLAIGDVETGAAAAGAQEGGQEGDQQATRYTLHFHYK